MPPLSPSALKPSARLTAVVDLPTPPLPEATAMIAPTSGPPCRGSPRGARRSGRAARGRGSRAVRGASRCRARLALCRQGDEGGLHARQRAHDFFGALAHGFPSLDLGGIARDGKKHLAVACHYI